MEIGIIGGGAIGLLFAAYLSKKHDVTVYTRTKNQAHMLIQNGVIVEGQEPFQAKLSYATNSVKYQEKVLIISVKQYHLENLIPLIKSLTPRIIIFLQNGMSHIEKVKELSMHDVYLGVVEHGVMKINDHKICHSGIGRTIISSFNNKDLSYINNLNIHDPSFPIEFSENWYNILAKKLLANAVINPLTALFNVSNGSLVTNLHFYRLAEKLFQEVWEALNLQNKNEHWAYVKDICLKTANNKSSMLKDLQNGRKTEVDAILGYILLEAERKTLNAPTVEFLYQSIKGIEIEREEGE